MPHRALVVLIALMARAANAASDTDDLVPMVLTVTLNGVNEGTALLLRRRDGVFYVNDTDLSQWHVCRSDQNSASFKDQSFHPFGGGASTVQRYDIAEQALELTLPPDCFANTNITLRPEASRLTPSALGGFLDYDFFASGSHNGLVDQDNLSGLLELGEFSSYGSLTANALAPNIVDHNSSQSDIRTPPLVRLDTTFTHDDAENMTSLELGDAIGASSIWGRPTRFAGVRFSRNFQTHPGYVTQPLPTIHGQAEMPSTVEVYLNGLLATRQQVQPGPFQIDDIPTFGSGGDVRLVVRDLLGRESVSDLPFVTGATLLRRGLSDFSIEAGTQRENYGMRSFDYAGNFFAATGRYGFTDNLTLEARTEASEDQYTSGVGGSVVVPWINYVLTSAIAESRSVIGDGTQETLGFQPGGLAPVGLNVFLQVNSARFVQLGALAAQPPPRYTAATSLHVPFFLKIGITVSQVRNAARDAAYSSSVSVNNPYSPVSSLPVNTGYSVVNSLAVNRSFGRYGSISLSAFETQRGERNSGGLLVYSLSIGGNRSVITTANVQRGADGATNTQFQSELDHLPTAEIGWGWDLRATQAGGAPSDTENNGIGAGLVYQGREYAATAQVDGNAHSAQYQMDIGGGIGFLGGRAFATRRIFDSFGIARVAGIPNVPVFVENQLAGYTDDHGRVVLPRLVEFADNKVSINADDLPFDAELSGSDSVTVAPYHRSGVIIDLPVRRFRSALVSLVLADGKPVPAGALVSYAEGGADVYVADRGEVYLRGVTATNNLMHVTWAGARHCVARFDMPTSANLQPRIGPLQCVEESR